MSAALVIENCLPHSRNHLSEGLTEADGDLPGEVWAAAKHYFDDLQYHTVRNMILDEGRPSTVVRQMRCVALPWR